MGNNIEWSSAMKWVGLLCIISWLNIFCNTNIFERYKDIHVSNFFITWLSMTYWTYRVGTLQLSGDYYARRYRLWWFYLWRKFENMRWSNDIRILYTQVLPIFVNLVNNFHLCHAYHDSYVLYVHTSTNIL